MKNLKRAYRRYKQEVKFERRIDIYVSKWQSACYQKNLTEQKNEIRKGNYATFLRTTLNPCNCFCCSEMNKYNRNNHKKINKQIIKEELY
jgi:hypothetical protein